MEHNIFIFISHSWAYSGHYEKLADWIFDREWNVNQIPIRFHNNSIPKSDPIHFARTDGELQRAIYYWINRSNVIVVPTGMYASHSKWIGKEIQGAALHKVPVLAVDPWGQQRKSSIVAEAADETVGWNSQSVVSGIWQLWIR